MNAHDLLSGLCPPGEALAFAAGIGNRRYHVSRLTWRPAGKGARLRIDGVIDQAALQMGSGLVFDRIDLTLNSTCRPRRYVRSSGRQRLEIRFGETMAEARLADGSSFQIAAAPAVVLDSNAPLLTALALRFMRAQSLTVAPAFIAGQLLPIDYRLTATAQGWCSSLEEEIALDGHGRLCALSMPRQGLTVWPASATDLPLLQRARRRTRLARPGVARPASASPATGVREFAVASPSGTVTALARVPAGAVRGRVLLLAGSGRVDRFGRAGGVDTGLGQIADGLAASGFLAMSADQPGAGDSPLGHTALTRSFAEEVADSAALLDAALALKEAPGPIAIVAHSLGGLVALALAAARPDDIAALVLLGVPGRPLPELMEDQLRWIGARRGLDPATISEQVAEHRQLMTAIRSVTDWTPASVPERFLAQRRLRDWLIGYVDLDPAAMLAATRGPVFLAQGALDVQVDAQADLGRLAQARPGLRTRCYAKLNHLFRAATADEGLDQYQSDTGRVATELIDDLVTFLEQAYAAPGPPVRASEGHPLN